MQGMRKEVKDSTINPTEYAIIICGLHRIKQYNVTDGQRMYYEQQYAVNCRSFVLHMFTTQKYMTWMESL